MGECVKVPVNNGDVLQAIRGFFEDLLKKNLVEAIMVPTRLPYKRAIMQTLVRDPARLAGVDPLAPVVPTNSARLAAQLTHDATGRFVAAVMRSCEIRAFIELVKLKQGRRDELLLIGTDCLGRYETSDFLRLDKGDPSFTARFYRDIRDGKGTARDGTDLARACKACEHPIAEGVDIRICTVGMDLDEGIFFQGVSDRGKKALSGLDLNRVERPQGADAAVEALLQERVAYRDQWLGEMREQTRDPDGLMNVLGNCINCYNCRVVCPVCYCRECVFVTDTFQHDSDQYFKWAEKRGMLRMPTDTLFYHLTRMQHMSTLCVGCGQCTSACPSDIPVSQLFRSVAQETQSLFQYTPGRDVEEALPLAVFYEKEFEQIAGEK
jgi:formate dehydrogenase subunit beta